MYARSIVLAFTIIFSTGLESCVFSFKYDNPVKKGTPSLRQVPKSDEEYRSNTQGNIKDYRKTLTWNEREGYKDHQGTLRRFNNKESRLRVNVHHRHHHHYHHKKPNNKIVEEHKFDIFYSDHTRRQGKFIDSNEVIKKNLKGFGRKRYRKKQIQIIGKNRRNNEIKKINGKHGKDVQGVLSSYQTDKRFMVSNDPGRNASAKRKRFHFSHALVNAVKLVLDKRNSFKEDANILDLAAALQSRDNENNVYKNNSITTAVSSGLTQSGQRVRLVRVKDPGYVENTTHRHSVGSQNQTYRSKISQDTKASHSALVNPTELGVSILKLLFGKKARIVTKPKYRHLVGVSRPKMKYLEGYGSKKQRAELEREIENENQMIILEGVKKHRLEETLAKSISSVIKAMNGDKEDSRGKAGKSQTKKYNSEVNMKNAVGNVGRKISSAEDHIGTRKSWVLLKMPKKNEEVVQDEISHYQEPEKENQHPSKISKISTHQVATLGKKDNELSDIKIIHQHKPHIESSFDDIASDDDKDSHASSRLKKPLVKYTHTDTESRTVPQISYNLNGIKSKSNVHKTSGVDSNGLALTLGKILKGIQESVNELKAQRKTKEPSPESSAVAKMTSPDMSSSLAKSNAVAKIPDLLAAVNKLLGAGSISSSLSIHPEVPRIPSDQTSVQNVPTMDNTDAAAARRYFNDVRASSDPLQLKPSVGYYDEPITSSVTSKMGVGDEKSLDNVLFESDELATQRDKQATVDAIRLKEDLEAFAERGLYVHNKYRDLHHAEKLKWSDDLATQAEKMAYDMAMKGTIEKSDVATALGYGENVAKITGTTFNKAGEEATKLWYAEVANYSFSDPRLSPQTDSFTQVVWKKTVKLGMGCARDLQTNDLYVVALYDPKGNDPVGLRTNVLNKGGVTEDVYASIFKRHRMQGQKNSRSKIGKSK